MLLPSYVIQHLFASFTVTAGENGVHPLPPVTIEHLLVGWKLADMIVTLGSLDINLGEVDR